MAFTRFHHVGLAVTDLEEAKHVLVDGFGLAIDYPLQRPCGPLPICPKTFREAPGAIRGFVWCPAMFLVARHNTSRAALHGIP